MSFYFIYKVITLSSHGYIMSLTFDHEIPMEEDVRGYNGWACEDDMWFPLVTYEWPMNDAKEKEKTYRQEGATRTCQWPMKREVSEPIERQ